jgi:hypothetical protein
MKTGTPESARPVAAGSNSPQMTISLTISFRIAAHAARSLLEQQGCALGQTMSRSTLLIPTQAGQAFRFEAGH